MNKENIIQIKPLGFPWETSDPFLFCAHHKDEYPKGTDNLGPDKDKGRFALHANRKQENK